MKKTIILAIASILISCSKDGISPKDKRNDCVDCTAQAFDLAGNPVGSINSSIDFKNITPSSIACPDCDNYCDYLQYMAGRNSIKLVIDCK